MVGPWSNNKPWVYSVCTMQIDKKSSAVLRGEREGIWGVRGGWGGRGCRELPEIRRGGREGWTVLWMDRVFNPPTHWIVCHRLLRLYVEWEELAESSWIPESLRHVVWLAEQNPHSGEEQTWLFPPSNGIFYQPGKRWFKVCTCYGCKRVTTFGDFSSFMKDFFLCDLYYIEFPSS